MEQTDIVNVQKHLTALLNDNIVKTLLKESHITKTQLETIYIDILAPNILQKHIKYADKVNLRIKDIKISRGAFTRTLRQSKRNIIKSINTILLLGYIGLFDTPRLQSYIEISNRLHSLLESYKEIDVNTNTDILSLLKQELIQDMQKGI